MSEDFRAATAQELALLEYLVRAPGAPAQGLLPQLQGIEAKADCTCGCPSVALRPQQGVPAADEASLEITAGCPGGILVLFVREGRLASLELACLDSVMAQWPALEVVTPPSAS
ncbi:MAG: hypothetical protein M9891_16705 [Austwickia sp.]|nr:hypothetical protein [Actinomycetota bacterium]MCB1251961.1 hypothetical protein [Austwickia sp.]MCO5310894.1 hypothetical protein [Austwickia sp.]